MERKSTLKDLSTEEVYCKAISDVVVVIAVQSFCRKGHCSAL